MAEVALGTPAAPAAPPPAPPAAAPSAPAGETPAAAAETPQTPAGETPAKPEDSEADRQRRHRRQLNTAYRKAAEAQARAELAERQLNDWRQQQQAPADPSAPVAPRLEAFKTLEEYTAAVEQYTEKRAKYESERAVKDLQTRQQGETQKQARARLTEQWETMTERGESKYADFSDVVGEVTPDTVFGAAMMSLENGEEVAYHFGKNMKDAERIAKLPAFQQILEIGRISERLAAAPKKPPTPSQAPAPINPVTGAAPASADIPSEEDDMRTWIRKRNKQLGRKTG